MRAGHSNLKARLSRFNIVTTAECECGDGLLGLYKLYEDQWATVIDILSENSKKEYTKSVTALLSLEKKKDLCKASVTS
jgi:hypothetical protein